MALSPLRSKKGLHHGRSLSLPSESHPSMSQCDENFSRLRDSEASCSSLSSMSKKINGLKNLYDSVDDLLLLPHIQQIISRERWKDQILDGYIRLLDSCSIAKDLISLTKQDVQQLMSALRRKDARGIHCYLNSRRKSNKMIQKSLKSFKSKHNIAISLEKDHEKMAVVCMLKEVESVTSATLVSLLSYVVGSKVQERHSSWSLVSKLMHSKKVGVEADLNEFKKVDYVLQMSQEDDTKFEEFMNHLNKMESNLLILEEDLEFLFRQLIKTRVFLLNISNQ